MNTAPQFCESCGSQLPPDVKFCLQCGAPVPEEGPGQATIQPTYSEWVSQPSPQNDPESPVSSSQPAYTPPLASNTPSPAAYTPPPPAYTPPPRPLSPPPPPKKSKLPCILIGGIVAVILICVGVVAVGAFLYFYPLNSNTTITETEVAVEPLPSEAIPLPPTEAPLEPTTSELPTEPAVAAPTEPVATAPTESVADTHPATLPVPSGGQDQAYTNAYSIFDPFNDNQLNWEIDDSGGLATMLEAGAYSMYTSEASTYFWVYPPVDFDPVVIEYDAWVDPATSTEDHGTYGVLCNYQDSANFTYVEIDPSDGMVYFAQFVDDEELSLRDENWTETQNFVIGPSEINRISVECYPDSINLFINDGHEALVAIDPPAAPGRSGLLIGTWDTINPNGYKVLFDNFYAYIPQQ